MVSYFLELENYMMMTDKPETFYLSWLDTRKGSRKPAGVAFFDTEFGDYRFKLDFFPENQYYLRCMGAEGKAVRYRLEVVQKNKEGKFLRRLPVGEGTSNEEGEVRIELFALDKELVLNLKDNSNEK